MILKIDLLRYADKDASVLSLKKNLTNGRSFDLFKIFLLTITSFSFDIFFDRQPKNISDQILWNFSSMK